ncbi:polysaccharide deacetylase family protein [Pseudomarimonas salicorniae]|uniref:Polysaccharide deacetylase family protein n=1 Tax=Pseudomarimonas salicorniae TaxID=2933270 RepID=A0ABT0GHF7_9GAMM|nr:polysaccharide deacetylase family protein [Lysobacter sp. CAU 1642]MCK7593981.1 polysaccharide deacetylase family protein [Lysobacter sp. CAU 1642]
MIRRAAKQAAFASGLAGALLERRGRRGDVPVVMYHGISPLTVSAEQLDAHFAFYARHFETRFFSDLDSAGKGRAPPLVLTFDDGMRSNFELAVPLLRKHGLKATFFIVSGVFDGLRYLWNHRLCYQLYALPDAQLPAACPLLPADPPGLGLLGERWQAARREVARVKTLPHAERIALCREVDARSEAAGVEFADWFDREYRLAGADQVRARPDCVEYGSHTRCHPVLTSGLDDAELADEIEGSRERLAAETGASIDTFCFPNGDHDLRVRRAVSRCYRLSCTTSQGIHRSSDDVHAIPRVAAAGRPVDMVTSLLLA